MDHAVSTKRGDWSTRGPVDGEERMRRMLTEAIGEALGVRPDRILSPVRGTARVALARQVAIYLARTRLGLSFTEAGRLLPPRPHDRRPMPAAGSRVAGRRPLRCAHRPPGRRDSPAGSHAGHLPMTMDADERRLAKRLSVAGTIVTISSDEATLVSGEPKAQRCRVAVSVAAVRGLLARGALEAAGDAGMLPTVACGPAHASPDACRRRPRCPASGTARRR